jgi:hypothetical protein
VIAFAAPAPQLGMRPFLYHCCAVPQRFIRFRHIAD